MNVKKATFSPEVGKTVELPEDIKRKDTYRFGGGGGASGHLRCTIVGVGDMTAWVVLRMDDDEAALPEGAEILGADVHQDTVWYCIPRSAYGGGDK